MTILIRALRCSCRSWFHRVSIYIANQAGVSAQSAAKEENAFKGKHRMGEKSGREKMILLLLIIEETGICHGLAAALLLQGKPIGNRPAAGATQKSPLVIPVQTARFP